MCAPDQVIVTRYPNAHDLNMLLCLLITHQKFQASDLTWKNE